MSRSLSERHRAGGVGGAGHEGVRQHDRAAAAARRGRRGPGAIAARERRLVAARGQAPGLRGRRRARGRGGRGPRPRRARSSSTPGVPTSCQRVRRCTPAASASRALKPSRTAESWLPLVTTVRRAGRGEPGERVVGQLHGVDRRQRAVVDVAGDQHQVDLLAPPRSRRRWSTKAACASSSPTPWKERPRCQSEVWRMRTPQTRRRAHRQIRVVTRRCARPRRRRRSGRRRRKPTRPSPASSASRTARRGRRADRGEHADAGGDRLLHDLEADPAAHAEHRRARARRRRAAGRRRPCRRRCAGRCPRARRAACPSSSNSPAACSPPVESKTRCASRSRVRQRRAAPRRDDRRSARAAAAHVASAPARRRCSRCRTRRRPRTAAVTVP